MVREGRLGAVLDFGSSGIGDPTCDTVLAWTFLSGARRERFRADYGANAATRSRGLRVVPVARRAGGRRVPREIDEILTDYAQDR